MDKYFYLIEYLNLSVGIFPLLEAGWGFLLIEYNHILLTRKFTKEIPFSPNCSLSTNTLAYSLDLCE